MPLDPSKPDPAAPPLDWRGDSSPTVVKFLTARGVDSVPSLLAFDSSVLGPAGRGSLRGPVDELKRKVRYSLAFRERHPLSPKELAEKMQRGLFFEDFLAVGSLGITEAPPGQFMRISRGVVFFDSLVPPRGKTFAGYAGYALLRPRLNTPRYGVWGDNEMDVARTREVFGMEEESLLILAQAYAQTIGPASFRAPRVSTSRSANTCELTGHYIPEDFPYLSFENFGTHVSLSGFYMHVGFASQWGRAGPVAAAMTTAGVTVEIWDALIQTVDLYDPLSSAEFRRLQKS